MMKKGFINPNKATGISFNRVSCESTFIGDRNLTTTAPTQKKPTSLTVSVAYKVVTTNPIQYLRNRNLPSDVITKVLSFCCPTALNLDLLSPEILNPLLQIYKATTVKRLHVKTEIVDALKNSDVVHIFQKLNELNPKLTATAIDMGFSLKQIATIPVDQLSEYITQYDDYVIPNDIQIQIDDLSVNGELNLLSRNLTTGQLCKILNALTDDQRNALTKLTLSNNQLTSLPDSIGYLSALRFLDLSNNQLTSLPDLIGGLSNLTLLSISYNQLTSLPNSFGNMSALESLYLSYNQLTSLPDSIGDLSNLTDLTLNDNQLTSLPNSFGNMSALESLYLLNNQLTSLPDSIRDLSNLTMLYLPFNNFDDDFKHAIQKQFPFAKL